MSSDAVLVEDRGSGVRLLTLNRPHVRNAMTPELTMSWGAALDDVQSDPRARVVVVAGAGTAFCAGADLSWMDHGSDEDVTPDRVRDRMLPFYRAWLRPREMAVPFVAAVQGPAIGAGLCLALACDLRLVGPDAVLAAPFLQLGMHAGMAATWLIPEAIGVVRAREMLYTGIEVHSEQAVDWGLASSVEVDVLETALATAQRIADAAPIAVRLLKTGLRERSSYEATLQWEGLAQPLTISTRDLHEGVQARRERRSPRFEGR